jgi:hypothetical protein
MLIESLRLVNVTVAVSLQTPGHLHNSSPDPPCQASKGQSSPQVINGAVL